MGAGTSCHLINFRAVEIPIQMLPHEHSRERCFFCFFLMSPLLSFRSPKEQRPAG